MKVLVFVGDDDYVDAIHKRAAEAVRFDYGPLATWLETKVYLPDDETAEGHRVDPQAILNDIKDLLESPRGQPS